MFDYQTSIHPYLDTACRRFSIAHNLTELAADMGISAQVLRNKLNPDQPHRLTVNELILLTVITDDSAVLDGLLAQLKCLPAVPVNEAKPDDLSLHTLSATAAIGVIAGEAISPAPMTQSRRNAILDRANQAIPHFTHSGTGYQLLANLGKAFSITDYVWYQLPDGGVFVGAAADALFAGKPIR